MNRKPIATIAAIALLPIAGFAQTPPAPPMPPTPPIPPDRHEKTPKIPVTFLGVETSEVPNVVSEQLGLAKGFGLVVDYVVPDSPAAAAGVQQNDIIKIFSIAAVVLLPPTLVASAYGMNFEVMPELKWVLGYPFALVLMVVSAVLPYLYFKRKVWL